MSLKVIKAGVSVLALLAATATTRAADVPVKAPIYKGPMRSVVAYYNWTGFYFGINGGYGLGKSSWDSPAVDPKPKGAFVGATLGYNWQAGAFVYGLEGDWAWSWIKGSEVCGAATCETKLPWFATGRVRLGYAFDRWLPYVTGGGAYGHVEASNTNLGFTSGSANRFGWTAGAGIEYAFLGNWSGKIEYLHMDLGKFDCATCSAVTPDNVTFSADMIRAGLNYKFSGPIFSRF